MPDNTTTAPSAKQHRLMHALFREVGVVDRDQRLALTAKIIGREVGSSIEMSIHEAGLVIDTLKQALGMPTHAGELAND